MITKIETTSNNGELPEMSKRYGRNQKRAAKAEILALEEKTAKLNGELKIKNESEYKAAVIIDIARDINPNAPIFRPKQVDESIWRTYARERIARCLSIADLDKPALMETINIIDLVEIRTVMESREFGSYMHFEVSAGNRQDRNMACAAYRISMNEFLRESNMNQMHEYISKDLAFHFQKAIGEYRQKTPMTSYGY